MKRLIKTVLTLSILFLFTSLSLASESPSPYASGNPQPVPYETPMPTYSAPPMPMETPAPDMSFIRQEQNMPVSVRAYEAMPAAENRYARVMDANVKETAPERENTRSKRDWYGYDDMESTTPIKTGYFRNIQQQSEYFRSIKFLNSVKVQKFNEPALQSRHFTQTDLDWNPDKKA